MIQDPGSIKWREIDSFFRCDDLVEFWLIRSVLLAMPFQTDIIASSDTASRYSHLLQPIRDLTKNWDVDVAAQLEEYLAEIERIKISFDEGKTTMNFAEAALVIQGSACVYSKKVEYLYTLVYQTLDLIASKKRLQQASSVDDQGKDTDASFKDEIEELQPLDDIKEATNIYLKDDEHVADRGIMARTPLALIPLGEEDKQDVLYSSTGEIIGSRNDFKMNTCIVHASGALLLDSTYLPLIDGSFKRLMTSTPGTAQDIQPRGDEQVPDEVMSDAVEVPAVDLPFEGMGPDDDFEPIELELMDTVCDGGVDDAGDEQEVQEGGEEREGLRARRTPQPNPVQHVPFKDPWELMNHHDPGHWKSCPLKKGKPFKLPPSLVSEQQTKKRKRKGAIPPEPKPPLVPINQFISNAFYSHASKMSKNSLKTPTFPEFEYLYWIEFRRRQKIEAKQRQLLSQLATEEEIEELYSIVQKNEDEEMRYNDDKEDSDDDDDFASGADEEVCYGSADAADPIAPMALEEPSEGVILSSYEELVRRYVEGYLTDAQHYAQETELTRRVREWEEKIVPVLSQEDMHRPFDIHKYGEEILDSFKAKPDQTFKTVVTGKEPFEICRLFLATLQLANNYNVEITADGIGETAVDTMKLRLLKRTPGNEAIAAFGGQSLA